MSAKTMGARPAAKHKKVYFIYYRKTDHKPFYFDSSTQTTTWRYPTDGTVYDPATKKPIQAPPMPMIKPNRRATVAVTHRRMPVPAEWIPTRFGADQTSNTIDELAAQQFRPVKGMDAKELASFTTKKLSAALLASADKSASKKAAKLFKMVTDYIGVGDAKKPVTIDEITAFACESECVDELYAQILKMSNGVPDPQVEAVARLLAAVSAVHLPSPELVPFVRSQIARLTKVDKVMSMMMFAYFRFNALADSGVSRFEGVRARDLIVACDVATAQYGVSLYENMWNQRKNHPGLPIPYILIYMHRMLVEKKCMSTQGIFRLPGNLGLVKQLIVEANTKDDGYLEAAAVNDVGSFYKQWFRDIPGGLLDKEHTEKLLTAKKETYVALANSLQMLHRNVLMHLIGFLRELATHSDVTMMGESNLAMVFGPNIIHSGKDDDPLMASKVTSTSSGFISTLIAEWDVSPIYPM